MQANIEGTSELLKKEEEETGADVNTEVTASIGNTSDITLTEDQKAI